MPEYIAAYDFGTSGVKVILLRFDGHVCAASEKGYALLHPGPDMTEQDPEEYWEAVCHVTREAMKQAQAAPQEIKALSFSVQALNLIPVDAEGRVLHNAISWLDKRAGRQAREINDIVGAELVRSQDFQSRLLWLKEEMPELYEKTAYFLDCSGFLQYRATGIMAVDAAHPGILHQHPALQAYFDATLGAAGLGDGKLAPMVEATRVYGLTDEKGAAELGLAPGTPVFGGCIDVPAAAAGAGCVREGDCNIYLGSSGWLSALVAEPTDAAPGSYYLSSIDPSLLIYGGCINSCCIAVNWITDMLYAPEKAELGGGCWQVINREVALVPPGCDGLMAAPWLYGEQFPVDDPDIRGAFINASGSHGRGHMAAAMMESVCMSLRWQLELYRKDHGRRPGFVVANGGGSLSEPWMQMLADVLGLPVKVAEQARHSGALGAAAAAAIGLGICGYDTLDRLIRTDREYQPRAELAELYKMRFEVFRELAAALAPMCRRLNERT